MKALVLAGGLPQIALINDLKQRGFFTILADYNENPVAKDYADKFYQVSTLDVDAITHIAKEEKVDFLITVCTDQALLTVAKVSEALELPSYVDYKTALNVTNKSYMKKVFVENDISTAKHVILSKYDETEVASLRYPLIVKPVDCNSSKGVKKILNISELKLAVEEAIKLSRTKTAVVEEYIEGEELSVDVYVENGKAHVLAVSSLDKLPNNDKFIICRSTCTSVIDENIKSKIELSAQKIADAFGLSNSPMLIQLISNGKDIYILEFSARTGGGEKFITIKEVSGFDVVKAVVDLVLGVKPQITKVEAAYKYCISQFVYCKPGIFDHLEGFEELEREGIIFKTMLFKWKGASFDSIESSGDRVAGYIIKADTKEELLEKQNIISSRIRVIDKNGNDMMRHDLVEDFNI